MQQGVPT
jgi:hypothetical protein